MKNKFKTIKFKSNNTILNIKKKKTLTKEFKNSNIYHFTDLTY